MKKLLLVPILLTGCMGWLTSALFAQDCTPSNTACTIDATSRLPACFGPDPAPEARVGQPYTLDMHFVIGRTYKASLLTVAITRLEVLSVDSLPKGMTYRLKSGNPADQDKNVTYPPGTPTSSKTGIFGCARISGTATEANKATDSAIVVTNVFIKTLDGSGNPTGNELNPDTFMPGFNPARFRYRIPVLPPISTDKNIFKDAQNLKLFPNPATGSTQLSYTLNTYSNVEYQIVGIDGRTVWSHAEENQGPGEHSMNIPLSHITAGLYTLNVKLGEQVITKKLSIQ